MCIVFTCGEHTFRKEIEGYEGVICQCHNCGNWAGRVIKSNPWFTFCFVPVIPLSMHGYEDIVCNICKFAQPLEHREDVKSMKGRGGQGPPPGMPPPNGGGPPQGWGQQGGYQAQPPQQGSMHYK